MAGNARHHAERHHHHRWDEHRPYSPSKRRLCGGGYLISGTVRNVNKRNIEVMLDTSVSDILFENGEVTGVRLTTEENETVTVAAKA